MNRIKTLVNLFTAVILFFSLLSLLGWVIHFKLFTSLNENLFPMGPNTSIVFILISTLIIFLINNLKVLKIYLFIILFFALLLSGIRFLEFVFDTSLTPSLFIFSNFDKMSFFTSANFLLAILSAYFLIFKSTTPIYRGIAGALGISVCFITLTFLFGYIIGSPLFYVGVKMPTMALNTTISFLLLGINLMLIYYKKDLADSQIKKLKIPLERKLILSFGLAFSLIVSIILIAYEGTLKLRNTNEQLTESSYFTGILNEISFLMKDALISERGYVITGNENYYLMFDSNYKKLTVIQNVINDLGLKKINYKDRIDSVKIILQKTISFYNLVLQTRKNEGFEKAQTMIATNHGENLIEQIDFILTQMRGKEKALLSFKRK